MLKTILLENKRKLKYQEYDIRGKIIEILGIGQKAIKYSEDGEEKFAFYDSFEGRLIAKELVKSFDNEIWNKEIREAIASQKTFCEENKIPMFAPQDGFCFSCGQQIYTRKANQASKEHITGCPYCHRSYCD